MRILVLGGNGSVGSHVVNELLDVRHKMSAFGRKYEMWRKPCRKLYPGEFSNIPLLAEALRELSLPCDWIVKRSEKLPWDTMGKLDSHAQT